MPEQPTARASQLANTAVHGARAVGAAMLSPFIGVGTIASRPSLWPFAITPTLLLLGLWAGGGALARAAYHSLVAKIAPHFGHAWWSSAGLWVVEALVVIALVAAVIIVASLIVPPLAGPFMDALAGKVDERPQREEPFYVGALRGARAAIAGMLLLLIPQTILFVLNLVASALSFIWIPLGVMFASLGLAYDALDWPLARRGLGVRQRLDWMANHKALVLGLGLGASVFAIVPGLLIVMLPALVVGAVRMVNRAENAEAMPAPTLPSAALPAPAPVTMGSVLGQPSSTSTGVRAP